MNAPHDRLHNAPEEGWFNDGGAGAERVVCALDFDHDRHERIRRLKAAAKKFTRRERQAFLLAFRHLNTMEIAERMGIGERRARAILDAIEKKIRRTRFCYSAPPRFPDYSGRAR